MSGEVSQKAREAAADLVALWEGNDPQGSTCGAIRGGHLDGHDFVESFAAFEAEIKAEIAGAVEGLKRPATMPPSWNAALDEALALVRIGGGNG